MRYFVIHECSISCKKSRFQGTKPYEIAKSFVRSFHTKIQKIKFSIRETTKDSKKKIYYYNAVRNPKTGVMITKSTKSTKNNKGFKYGGNEGLNISGEKEQNISFLNGQLIVIRDIQNDNKYLSRLDSGESPDNSNPLYIKKDSNFTNPLFALINTGALKLSTEFTDNCIWKFNIEKKGDITKVYISIPDTKDYPNGKNPDQFLGVRATPIMQSSEVHIYMTEGAESLNIVKEMIENPFYANRFKIEQTSFGFGVKENTNRETTGISSKTMIANAKKRIRSASNKTGETPSKKRDKNSPKNA